MAKKGPKNPLSEEHKAAMAAGRSEGRAVRDYLEALRKNKPRPGRKRTADSIRARIEKIDAELLDSDPINELRLLQERRDLSVELATMGTGTDMSVLESEFVKAAKGYSERHGITYATWREVGVEAAVLKAAGITRGA